MAQPIRFPLNHGKVALIDAVDLPRIAPFRWYASFDGDRWYAKRGERIGKGAAARTRSISMHHLLLDVPPGTLVTHLNGDMLDNRKANLRIVSREEAAARRGLNRNNSSGYRGVNFDKATGMWRAHLVTDGTKRSLGYFATAEEAARAYDVAAYGVWGALAYQNFPPSVVAPAASYDTAQAAILLGITRASVIHQIHRGVLQATREGKRWCIAAAEIERYREVDQRRRDAHPYHRGRGMQRS